MQIYRFYVLSASSDPDNYRYVGVTSRKSVQERFYGHKYCAMHENKRVLPVHKWMYKHYQLDEEILVKEIHSCDKSIWKEEEKRLIKEYKEAGCNLLNLQDGGEGVVTKDMRNLDGITRSANAHKKQIVAINPDTMEVAFTFNCIKDAASYFNVAKTAISNALNQTRQKNNHKNYIKSCGYYWLFKEDYDLNGVSSINITVVPTSTQKCIYKFDGNGNLLGEYWNIREMIRNNIIASENGLKSAIENKKFYNGSYWSYNKDIDMTQYSKLYRFAEIDNNEQIIEKYEKLQDICDKYGGCISRWSTRISKGYVLKNGNKIIKIKI